MERLARVLLAVTIAAAIVCVTTAPALATRRALLIGVSSYQHLPKLVNPQVDVEKVGQKLVDAQYVVTTINDPDTGRDRLVVAIDKFLRTIKQNDEILVYYSGHGVDLSGDNMIVPADSPSSQDVGGEFALKQQLISMRPLMLQIEDRAPSIQIWIIDACRENPYASGGRPFAAPGGLERFPDRPNSFIMFAANYSQIARDTLPSDPPQSGFGSPFSRTFAKLFDSWKDKDIRSFAAQVRRDVVRLVNPDPQFPVFEDGVLDQWCFVACGAGVQEVEIVTNSTRITTPTLGPGNKSGSDYSDLIGEQSVVFLGKESARQCYPVSISDSYPFGCTILQQLSSYFNSNDRNPTGGLVGQTVTATTGVNVRRGLPKTDPNGTTLGCQVRVLMPGTPAKILSTVALKYAGDTFYWGLIEDGKPDCASTKVGTAVGVPPSALSTPPKGGRYGPPGTPPGYDRGMYTTWHCGSNPESWVRSSASYDRNSSNLTITVQLETDSIIAGPKGYAIFTLRDKDGKALATARTKDVGIGGRSGSHAAIQDFSQTVPIPSSIAARIASLDGQSFCNGSVAGLLGSGGDSHLDGIEVTLAR